MRKLLSLALVALVAVALGAVPAQAAPKALSEAELDQVTAAGQPEVLVGGALTSDGFAPSGAVTLGGTTEALLTIAGQTDLVALVLNNVAGENAVATALNISSSRNSVGGSQTNLIEQSWGSTLDVASRATAAAAGGTVSVDKCILSDCSAGAAASAVVGIQSIYSDEILMGFTVEKFPEKQYDLTLDTTAQQNLAALAVNNVVGINLVATAINIASSDIRINSPSILNFDGTGASTTVDQSNTIRQYRGTPLTRP